MVVDLAPDALLVPGEDGLAGDLRCTLEPALAEVARRQAARFVEDVDQHGSSIGVQRALRLGDRVLAERGGELLAARVEGRLVGNRDVRAARVIDDDRLEPLRAHHRAEPAAAGVAAGASVAVGEADAGGAHSMFAGDADRADVDLVLAAELRGDRADGLRQLLPDPRVGRFERRALGVDLEQPEAAVRRLTFDDQGAQAEPREAASPSGAGVRLLDAARERALAADRDPRRGRRRGPGHDAGREDDLVVRPQRVAGRRNLVVHEARRQPSSGSMSVRGRHRLELHRAVRHVDAQHSVHAHSRPLRLCVQRVPRSSTSGPRESTDLAPPRVVECREERGWRWKDVNWLL